MRSWSVKCGTSRLVVLTSHSAFKLPRPDRWRRLLTGLLANLDEVNLSRQNLPRLCPVKWSLPGGLLVVMPRAEDLPFHEVQKALDEYYDEPGPRIQLPEVKHDAIKSLNGEWVIVDYGNVY